MYKIYFKNRFITVSDQPDRLQKYGLFYKFLNTEDLYNKINCFIHDETIPSMNIFGHATDHIMKAFSGYFKTVEAAGGLIQNDEGRYLFIERNGMVDLPKGHVEQGETAEECALREVAEECGIQGHTIIKPITVTYHYYKLENEDILKKTYWFLMYYEGTETGSPQTEEGITAIKWLAPTETKSIQGKAWASLTELINYAARTHPLL